MAGLWRDELLALIAKLEIAVNNVTEIETEDKKALLHVLADFKQKFQPPPRPKR